MKKIYDKCCSIDVYKRIIVACFIHGKEQGVHEFGTATSELMKLADWLIQGNCHEIPANLNIFKNKTYYSGSLRFLATRKFWLHSK